MISNDTQKSPILGSLRYTIKKAVSEKSGHPTDNAGSTTTFSSIDAFPSVSLSAK